MNNKKLFKGALVLFASILMAVSCSSNPNDPNKKEEGGDKPTAITKEQVQTFLQKIGTVTEKSATFDFSTATLTEGSTDSSITVTVSGSGNPAIADTLAALKTALKGLPQDNKSGNLIKLKKGASDADINAYVDRVNWSTEPSTSTASGVNDGTYTIELEPVNSKTHTLDTKLSKIKLILKSKSGQIWA